MMDKVFNSINFMKNDCKLKLTLPGCISKNSSKAIQSDKKLSFQQAEF